MAMMLVFLTHFSTDCQETLPPVPRATFIFEMATKSPWERINTQDPSFLSFLPFFSVLLQTPCYSQFRVQARHFSEHMIIKKTILTTDVFRMSMRWHRICNKAVPSGPV
jgi:hypothetical protein